MIANPAAEGRDSAIMAAGRRTLIMINMPGALTSPLMGEVESARSADRVRVTPPKPGIEAMVENLLKDRARQMRREPTEAERRMWRLLRDRRLGGFKFRRQEQLGRYIVDFVCFERKLIVELDGSQHAESAYDAERDAWLRSRDFSVLRFWNNEVFENPVGVLDAVARLGLEWLA
jgi:very-short-patch-repair endonuclease